MEHINSREIEESVDKVKKSLGMWQDTGLKNLIEVNCQSIKECMDIQQQAITTCDKKREQLTKKKQELEQYESVLLEAEEEFEKFRKQKLNDSQKELEKLLDDQTRDKIVNKREELSRYSREVLTHTPGPIITTDMYKRMQQVRIYESFALDYEKVKDLSLEDVWQQIEILCGPD